jgi:hypothetical protein
LRRVFEIFRLGASRGKRFVVILDCCRAGDGGPLVADDVPANVVVLYACPLGQKVGERSSGGGTLTRVVYLALQQAAVHHSEGISVYDVHREAEKLLQIDINFPNPTHEIHGGRADRVILPVNRSLARPQAGGPPVWPRFLLQSYDLGSSDNLIAAVNRIRDHYLSWSGRDRDDAQQRDEWISSRICMTEGGTAFRVVLPTSGSLPPRSMLKRLLEMFPSFFQRLIARWDGTVEPSAFHPLVRKLPGADQSWVYAPDRDTALLRFRKSDATTATPCQLWVYFGASRTGDARRTEAHAFSEVRGLEYLPLDRLLPELADWMDLLGSINPTPASQAGQD